MKVRAFFILLFFASCTGGTNHETQEEIKDTISRDTVISEPVVEKLDTIVAAPKTYSNKRFRNVTVEKVGANTYQIKGQGQIFEASFSWVVEDGHNELKKGFETTDAGAPEWGNFNFNIEVKKDRTNSTLTLILFEASAKDGSRQHELPIVLE